jgi:hypothetical protein
MVDGRELRWFGHLMRMDSNRKPRQVWVQELRGCKGEKGQGQNGKSICRCWWRKKGRPCSRWLGWQRTEKHSWSGSCNLTPERETRE